MRLVVVLLTRRFIYKYEMGLKWVWELSMDKFLSFASHSFRRGLNKPRVGLPLVVVRACVRVGNPQKALHYVTDKVNEIGLHFV